ncbi:Uncharacterized protein M6B38_248445 [Iris pallida]|uniref:Uncharacterized protein n=1 Tax=Iris pallida TaxID=29817 RepID=A0AAX6DGE4_IRIPA|nr:Uncharacterized protein M6B38_248445 [Iris pallida]
MTLFISMALLQSSTTISIRLSLLPVFSSSSPPIPARDRTITFGKHKGRMLGSLPSKYLTWVSKNLRARDFREWAELADQVLADEVYRDRLEWESAERILSGNDLHNTTSTSSSPVSDLLDVSHRFGWDNRDKAAWARVDFALLGTSKGGRIPRIGTRQPLNQVEVVDDDDDHSRKKKKMAGVGVGVGGKREERRERRRARNTGKEVENGTCASAGSGSGKWVNPFPGRGALLDKIKRGKEEKEEEEEGEVVNWW